jgi:hypothetical protein
VGEEEILNKVYRPVTGQGVWREVTNQEVRKSCNTPDVVAVIKRRRAEWLKHIIRRAQTRGNKNIF